MSDQEKRDAFKVFRNSRTRYEGSDWAAFSAGWDAAKATEQPKTIPARTGDPDTSHKATREIQVRANSQRAYLLESFYNAFHHAPEGYTDEQAAGWHYMVHMRSEYAKRCSELREAGFIEPTGETRRGASGMDRMVSRITDKGRRAVEKMWAK